MLPREEDPGSYNQLTVMVDSGPTVRAGAEFFKNHIGLNLFVIYGQVHRMIRDIKLFLEHGLNKSVYRSLLHFTYIAGLNHQHYGGGNVFHEKQTLLENLLREVDHNSAEFRKYAAKIAENFGITGYNDEDVEHRKTVFELLKILPSFQHKYGKPKLMRWFSSNESYKLTWKELWALKLVLQHGFALDDDIGDCRDPATVMGADPRRELRELRANNGGLRLADKLICEFLYRTMPVYYWVTKATWTNYTYRLKCVKRPSQGVAWICGQAAGEWREEIHAIFECSFENQQGLSEMGLDWRAGPDESDLQQDRAFLKTTHIISQNNKKTHNTIKKQ